jgi:pilus assembly protein Flp/PilA
MIRLSTWLDAMRREEGQTLVEYALIIALVSVAVTALLTALGTGIGGIFTTITGSL